MAGVRTVLLGALAGFLIAFALPPWGWWPSALLGFALFDYLGLGASGRLRFFSGWATGAVWLGMGEFWVVDLSPAGYAFVFVVFGAGYGVLNVIAGSDDRRLIALPAGFALFEWVRWSWPFGGVPLATVPMTQVDTVFTQVLPLGGGVLMTAVIVAAGSGLRLVLTRRFDLAVIVIGAVTIAIIGGTLVPRTEVIGEFDVAVVQGGGPQRTRADACQNQAVFDRHRDATATIDREVDLILWPENVVNPIEDGVPLGRCDDLLFMTEAQEAVAEIAIEQDAVLVPGWFHGAGPEFPNRTVNFSTTVSPEGDTISRYDKVRLVPFGEFVPLRGFIELFSSEIPNRDVLEGEGPAILESDVATLGVSISWEIFFESRGRAAIRDGGEVLTNPTNGSSFWLTILQTQQIASSRLRALESDRWVLQAAPTGFSGIIDPDGNVLQRTDISEQRVLFDTIERRTGLTPATRFGPTPWLILALAAFVAVSLRARRAESLDHR